MTQTAPRPVTQQQTAQPARPTLPERPKLAPGVRLAGQMNESAFVDPPWLLEREGAGYIQVTQLLYLIAEQCDGSHSIDEIARAVSDRSGRGISADNVRQLVARQLVPRGLIEIPGVELPKVESGARSPLALNMRVRMIGPETIGPLTSVLRILYWPPVLFGVLLAAVAAEVWIYLIHGVGSGVHDAIYSPGLMLAVLGAIVISAGFHELGHAAALHYGGGRIKGMGAGVYIVYPAFFTDVSDNYRLGRLGRIRTDLGGFYFNLIFALALLGVYFLTGQEVLLMIVVLINLEIIHQLLPFLRLDGYWTLADITGVPDFFSQMSAFARSVLPIKQLSGGRKLPALKTWAKVVFGVYMLITIPLLGLLMLLMVKSVPRVFGTVWDSAGKQAQAFSQAAAGHDVLGMLGAAGQIFLLALPTIGLCWTLFSLGRRLLAGLWNWSKPTPKRRVVGALGTLAAAALVGFMWAPQLPIGGRPGPLYNQVTFDPIAANERGTVQDAVAGVVATREPQATTTAVPSTTAVATQVPGASTPFATPASGDLTPQAQATAQPQATVARPQATSASAPAPPPAVATAVQATAQPVQRVATAVATSRTAATPTPRPLP